MAKKAKNVVVKKAYLTPERESFFWEKVEKVEDDKCWKWLGSPQFDRKGKPAYGKFRIADGEIEWAHRVMYFLIYGNLPANKPLVRHTCRNKMCVNPRHLAAGDAKDNLQDEINAGADTHIYKEGHIPWIKNKTKITINGTTIWIDKDQLHTLSINNEEIEHEG